MKIALIQTNPLIGAFERNLRGILTWLDRARARGCQLAILPELCLCGYPPQDLLEHPAFIQAHDRALAALVARTGDMACVIGALERRHGPGKPLYNTALFIQGGRVRYQGRKQLLPTYDVFDELRYFEPGSGTTVALLQEHGFGLTVCEDIWFEQGSHHTDPVAGLMASDLRPDFLINISASPYYHGKIDLRTRVFSSLCRRFQVPLLYVNQVGGQDGLLFDGHSMVMDQQGTVMLAGKGFAEDMLIYDIESPGTPMPEPPVDGLEQVVAALVAGVRDYLGKSGFTQALVGLSGGIDSAVTAAIGCLALGPEHVLAVGLPSPYTSAASLEDAQALAANLGCAFESIPITGLMRAFEHSLHPLFRDRPEDVTEQNIQARIRGNLLMALSNKFGHLLLSTGNKSEMAVGYCTLYGDMSGGLAVLADVPKVMVYQLAHLLNRERQVIPARIIQRPPSAELKPGQRDQDDLPPYEILDGILECYLEERLSVDEIVARGYDRAVVRDVIHRIKRNEYKRQQAPLGLKVTSKAFGIGRRYPVVQGFEEQ